MSFSRKKYFELTLSKNQYTLFNCFCNAFEYFGGVPDELLFDNMKTVSNRKVFNKMQINTKAYAFANDVGFKIRLCKPRSPETKGKIETQMKFLEDLKMYNGRFECLEDLIKIVKDFQEQVNRQISQGNGKIPNLAFLKEKEHLKPFDKDLAETYLKKLLNRSVASDSTISYGGNRYSVPIEFTNKQVFCEEYDDELHIYYTPKK